MGKRAEMSSLSNENNWTHKMYEIANTIFIFSHSDSSV